MQKVFKEKVLKDIEKHFEDHLKNYKIFASGKVRGGLTFRWKYDKFIHFYIIIYFQPGREYVMLAGAWTKNGKMPKEDYMILTIQKLRNSSIFEVYHQEEQGWLSPDRVGALSNQFKTSPLNDEWLALALNHSDLKENYDIRFNDNDHWWGDWEQLSDTLNKPLTDKDIQYALEKPLAEVKDAISLFDDFFNKCSKVIDE